MEVLSATRHLIICCCYLSLTLFSFKKFRAKILLEELKTSSPINLLVAEAYSLFYCAFRWYSWFAQSSSEPLTEPQTLSSSSSSSSLSYSSSRTSCNVRRPRLVTLLIKASDVSILPTRPHRPPKREKALSNDRHRDSNMSTTSFQWVSPSAREILASPRPFSLNINTDISSNTRRRCCCKSEVAFALQFVQVLNLTVCLRFRFTLLFVLFA